MTLKRTLALLTTPPLLMALTAPGESPTFQPVEGEEVSKRFTFLTSLGLDDYSLFVNGQDLGGVMGAVDFGLEFQQNVGVTDVYEKVGAGMPIKLVRTFDSLGGEVVVSVAAGPGNDDQDVSLESALEGETVIFEWNEETGEYDISFEDDGDESLLAGLTEDMDLRALLPSTEVSIGDSWRVELSDLENVAAPGGELGFGADDVDTSDAEMWEELFGEEFKDKFNDLLDGRCECTYQGIIEQDGARLAEIAIEVEISVSADLSELIMQVIDAAAAEFGGELDADIEAADLNLDFEGTGTLLWDLGAGHAYGFDLNGGMDFALDLSVVVEEEETISAEVSVEMSGQYEYTLETGN